MARKLVTSSAFSQKTRTRTRANQYIEYSANYICPLPSISVFSL